MTKQNFKRCMVCGYLLPESAARCKYCGGPVRVDTDPTLRKKTGAPMPGKIAAKAAAPLDNSGGGRG